MPASKHDRSPKDLSVPETMRIAALLAELMPPDNLDEVSSAPAEEPDIPPVSDPQFGVVEQAAANPMQTMLVEVMPTMPEPVDPFVGLAQAIKPLAAKVGSAQGVDRIVPKSESAQGQPKPAPLSGSAQGESRPLSGSAQGRARSTRITATVTSGPGVLVSTPASEPEVASPPLAPTPAQTVARTPSSATPPTRRALDPELIPLGGISVAGFFSLVNWNNSPDRVKLPKRADYGLDEATLTHARKNPFYLIGQPRKPESKTVAEILSEIEWE
jgi:hypothetical protein